MNQDKSKEQDTVRTFPMERSSPLRPADEYAELRRSCPITKARTWDGSMVWLTTKHKDVCQVLSDPAFSKVRTHPGFPETGPGGKAAATATKPAFVDMDPPEHKRHRDMVEQDFTLENTQRLRPKIESFAKQLVEDMKKQKQPVDLHTAYSLPLPTLVIYDMLGIPYKDQQFLEQQNAIRTNGSATSAESSTASKALVDYISNLAKEKEKEGSGDDIISRLMKEQVKKGHLTQDELVSMAFLLLVAGNATTANMITLGMLTLLQHPDQLAELKRDPSLMPGAVEELLRFITASQFATRRVAIQDVTVGGVLFRKNEGVWALNASANDDESVFENPTKFDIHRKKNPHLAFGYGIHECIALHLARAEVEIGIRTLITCLPDLKLAVPYEEIQFVKEAKKNYGVEALPVTF